MIDVEKQVRYWREGAAEDWEVAQDLIDSGKVRHGLFFAHLTLEKILKHLPADKPAILLQKFTTF